MLNHKRKGKRAVALPRDHDSSDQEELHDEVIIGLGSDHLHKLVYSHRFRTEKSMLFAYFPGEYAFSLKTPSHIAIYA